MVRGDWHAAGRSRRSRRGHASRNVTHPFGDCPTDWAGEIWFWGQCIPWNKCHCEGYHTNCLGVEFVNWYHHWAVERCSDGRCAWCWYRRVSRRGWKYVIHQEGCFRIHAYADICIACWVVSVLLMTHRCPKGSCFAGPNAFVPRVTKFCATGTAAIFEPRTSATATTGFAGFRDDSTLGT